MTLTRRDQINGLIDDLLKADTHEVRLSIEAQIHAHVSAYSAMMKNYLNAEENNFGSKKITMMILESLSKKENKISSLYFFDYFLCHLSLDITLYFFAPPARGIKGFIVALLFKFF